MEQVLGWVALMVSAVGLFAALKADGEIRRLNRRIDELHNIEIARVNQFISASIELNRRR